MNERYRVGSVTGWAITPSAGRPPRRPPATIFYVFDSFYCYRPVAEFTRSRHAERLAHELAERLNHEEAAA